MCGLRSFLTDLATFVFSPLFSGAESPWLWPLKLCWPRGCTRAQHPSPLHGHLNHIAGMKAYFRNDGKASLVLFNRRIKNNKECKKLGHQLVKKRAKFS